MGKHTIAFAVLPLLAALGCGDDSGSGAGAGGGPAAGPGPSVGSGGAGGFGGMGGSPTAGGSPGAGGAGAGDTVPPIVLGVSPADGDAGILEDAEIVITFSEPMDGPATEAAYVSADLPASDVSFGWNSAGDELTITPNEPLEYAVGADESVVAKSYKFALVTSATDAAGNDLTQPLEVTFSTARRIVVDLPYDDPMSHTILELGASAGFAAGDGYNALNQTESWSRLVLTFDISGLPANVLQWTSATLKTEQNDIFSHPYAHLGDVHAHDVSFSAQNGAFDAAHNPGADLGALSTSAALGPKSLDVTAEVVDDHPGARSQFVVKFQVDHSGDTHTDKAIFDPNATVLAIDLLIE